MLRPLMMPTVQLRSVGRIAAQAVGFVALFCAFAGPLSGAKVELKIKVGNPIEKQQSVVVSTNLPPYITTNDIISLNGLDLGYDVKSGTYYVHKALDLGPKETRFFLVELRDVWVIPPEEIAKIRKRSLELVSKLEGKPDFKDAGALKTELDKSLDLVEASQQQAALKPGDKVTDHIKTYEANLGTYKRVKEGLGRIENYVLAAGLDPGADLIGEVKGLAVPKYENDLPAEAYKPIVFRITIQNTSPRLARKKLLKRMLPAEVKLDDILEPGGLDTGVDTKSGAVYVWKDEVEIPAAGAVSFDVKIRDKWNVNMPRIEAVNSSISNLLATVRLKGGFDSIDAMLTRLGGELDAIAKTAGPEQLSDEYVAFHRSQAAGIDVIEQQVLRIEAALRPSSKNTARGFATKAPSLKTTWLIIYIILGFLAIMSILFFLRWYGKSGAEKMDETDKGA